MVPVGKIVTHVFADAAGPYAVLQTVAPPEPASEPHTAPDLCLTCGAYWRCEHRATAATWRQHYGDARNT